MVVRFILLYILFYVLLVRLQPPVVQNLVASALGFVLGLPVEGNNVGPWKIVPECTGFVSVSLVLALVFSFPLPPRRRLSLLLILVPFALVLNFLRLLLVALSPLPSLTHTVTWITNPLILFLLFLRLSEIQVSRSARSSPGSQPDRHT